MTAREGIMSYSINRSVLVPALDRVIDRYAAQFPGDPDVQIAAAELKEVARTMGAFLVGGWFSRTERCGCLVGTYLAEPFIGRATNDLQRTSGGPGIGGNREDFLLCVGGGADEAVRGAINMAHGKMPIPVVDDVSFIGDVSHEIVTGVQFTPTVVPQPA